MCVCVCVCVCERERERERQTDRETDRQRQREREAEKEVEGGNKGIWLQNWVTVWNTWLPVVKDEQHWGKGWANKGPPEESLISAGRLTRKVSSVHAFPAGVGLPLPEQLSSAFQLLKLTEGAFTASSSVSPLKRVGSLLPCHVNVMYHFHRASGTKETVSYRCVAVCVLVCAWDGFLSPWPSQSLLEDEIKLLLKPRRAKWTWKKCAYVKNETLEN